MRAETDKKMTKLTDMDGGNLTHVTFLLDAVNTVIDCRRILQWSYPWSYMLDDGSPIKAHLKMHMDMLEEFTEELSHMTEQPLQKLLQSKARSAIINHTRVIQKFRQNVIDFAKQNHDEKHLKVPT